MKYNTLVVAPIFTRSGYGDLARDVVSHLLNDPRFDIKVMPTRWGDTPENIEKTPVETQLASEGRVITSMTRRPDVFVQVTVPNKFNPVGHFNVGITAGIEADRCSPDWVEGCNRMNLVLATSQFAKDSLVMRLPNGEVVAPRTPVEVVPISVDVDLWKDSKRVPEMQRLIDSIPENFLFLFVGHWLNGSYGEDRKDLARLIDIFSVVFNGNRKVGLLLKISLGTHSVSDRIELLKRIRAIQKHRTHPPKVHLLHGELTDREMSTVFRHVKVKSLVSITHGEGFMISGLLFSLSGKPLILPNYSGHLDYLVKGHPTMTVEMQDVPPVGLPQGMIGSGAKWGKVPDQVVADALIKVFTQYDLARAIAVDQSRHVEKNFSRSAVGNKLIKTLDAHLGSVPFEETIEIPELPSITEDVNVTI